MSKRLQAWGRTSTEVLGLAPWGRWERCCMWVGRACLLGSFWRQGVPRTAQFMNALFFVRSSCMLTSGCFAYSGLLIQRSWRVCASVCMRCEISGISTSWPRHGPRHMRGGAVARTYAAPPGTYILSWILWLVPWFPGQLAVHGPCGRCAVFLQKPCACFPRSCGACRPGPSCRGGGIFVLLQCLLVFLLAWVVAFSHCVPHGEAPKCCPP